MQRYYTRACNFYFGNQSKNLVNKKKAIPLHQIKEISFDHVEIIFLDFLVIISSLSNEILLSPLSGRVFFFLIKAFDFDP